MNYEAKNFDHLLGLSGFSDTLLKNHFTLYQGYVNNTNKVVETLKTVEAGTPQWNELKRRFGWEWNGMRLHELYFGNMKLDGSALKDDGELKKVMNYVWGSFEDWKKDFVSCGTMRGIGWVVLAYDPEKKMVFNTWINEHDAGHLAGATPILVMDVFEHAYISDYGLKRADYIEAFMNAIDWEVVEKRFS
ncbi:MAG: Fe-Mn family superoxide dismutase [Candidatus Paceibacterota bacterium]|jgi:Fe-Mn family superoxide dismutase